MTYTKEEVDAMRDALAQEHLERERIRLSNPSLSWEFLSFREVEDRLKTYILAGVHFDNASVLRGELPENIDRQVDAWLAKVKEQQASESVLPSSNPTE